MTYPGIQFTNDQLGTISNALRVAAEAFKGTAAQFSDNDRLANQFRRQAKATLELYMLIGEKEGIQN